MFYYPILTTKKLPVMFYYSSEIELVIGQLVIVNLQNQLLEGVVFGASKTDQEIVDQLKLELDKIKEISKIQPFVLPGNQTQFLRFLINNTFNNAGIILAGFLQPLKILNQKHWQQLEVSKNLLSQKLMVNTFLTEEELKSNQDKQSTQINTKKALELGQKPEVNFWLESDYSMRIMYIIRSRQTFLAKTLGEKSTKSKIKTSIDLNLLTKTKLIELSNGKNSSSSEKNDLHISSLEDKKNIFDIVIIFPENKLLDKIWQNFSNKPLWLKNLDKIQDSGWLVENYFYTSKINQKSRQTILELLSLKSANSKNSQKLKKSTPTKSGQLSKLEKNSLSDDSQTLNQTNDRPKIRIIWGTRSALFLPFFNLVQVILVDEANSFHIQEQNSLYFDSREAVFLLHQATHCHLDFVSQLPSVRFQTFYQSSQVVKNTGQSQKANLQDKLKINITSSPQKYYLNNLFSYPIEQLLKKETDVYLGEND